MQYRTEGEHLVLLLCGRIDSSNARQTETEAVELLRAHPDLIPVLDAEHLIYVSSAGLRLLLRLAKSRPEPVEIRNLSPEVLNTLEITGLDTLFRTRKKLREISIDGCEMIGQGFFGKVYRLDEDTIVKVYSGSDSIPMIENERRMARMALLKGVPTAISYDMVKVGNSYGAVFELLNAKTMNDLLREHPENRDKIIRQYAGLIRQVHGIEMDPGSLPDSREIFLGYLDIIRDHLASGQNLRLRELLRAMPADRRMIHGDLQMKNIMVTDEGPMLIDMDTLSMGHPVFDLQGIYLAYQLFQADEPDNSRNFFGIDPDTCDRVWKKGFPLFLGTEDPTVLNQAMDRIRILSAIRLLYLLVTTRLKEGELGALRFRRARETLKTILPRMDSLIW